MQKKAMKDEGNARVNMLQVHAVEGQDVRAVHHVAETDERLERLDI